MVSQVPTNLPTVSDSTFQHLGPAFFLPRVCALSGSPFLPTRQLPSPFLAPPQDLSSSVSQKLVLAASGHSAPGPRPEGNAVVMDTAPAPFGCAPSPPSPPPTCGSELASPPQLRLCPSRSALPRPRAPASPPTPGLPQPRGVAGTTGARERASGRACALATSPSGDPGRCRSRLGRTRGGRGEGGAASLPALSKAETRAGGRSRRHRTSARGCCSSCCPRPRRRLSGLFCDYPSSCWERARKRRRRETPTDPQR